MLLQALRLIDTVQTKNDDQKVVDLPGMVELPDTASGSASQSSEVLQV